MEHQADLQVRPAHSTHLWICWCGRVPLHSPTLTRCHMTPCAVLLQPCCAGGGWRCTAGLRLTTVQGLLSPSPLSALCDVWIQVRRRQAYAKQHGRLAQGWPEQARSWLSGLIDWRKGSGEGWASALFRVRFLSLRLARRCITTNHTHYYIYISRACDCFHMLHARSMAFCACRCGHRRP